MSARKERTGNEFDVAKPKGCKGFSRVGQLIAGRSHDIHNDLENFEAAS